MGWGLAEGIAVRRYARLPAAVPARCGRGRWQSLCALAAGHGRGRFEQVGATGARNARSLSRHVRGQDARAAVGKSRGSTAAFAKAARRHALVISSYALLHRDLEHLRRIDWAGIVLDEAQNIKNAEARQSQAARSLGSDYRVALTGTPVENNVGELWSIMEFLNPGLLGTQAQFRRSFYLPIQASGDREAAARLKRIVGPFVLRRLKTDRDIIADLPEKLEMKVYCTLTREQASLYGAVLKDLEAELEQADGIRRRGLISDAKLHAARANSYYYPDVMVSYEERLRDLAPGEAVVSAPVLVVEVLSPATETIDRREKLTAYKKIESLKEYLLIDPDRFIVELHRRVENGWEWLQYAEEEPVELVAVPLTLSRFAMFEGLEKA